MLYFSLSSIDFTSINDFFTSLMENKLAFYLSIGGVALLFIGILALIIGVSIKKKAKKAAKKASASKNKESARPAQQAPTAPVARPIAAQAARPTSAPAVRPTPAPAVRPTPTPASVAKPTPTPVVKPTPAPVVMPEPELTEERVPDPYDAVPVYDNVEESVTENKFAPVANEDVSVAEPIEYVTPVPAEDISMVDGGWKTAKLNLKRNTPKSAKSKTTAEPVSDNVPETEEEQIIESAPVIIKDKPAPVRKAVPKSSDNKEMSGASKKTTSQKSTSTKKDSVAKTVTANKESATKTSPAEKPKVVGKYVIEENSYAFQFILYANNGQLLYESREYASANSCKNGIETFKKNIADCEYRIDVDKNGGYKYIFKKGNSLYIGETYSTSKAAERSAESVKRFANISELAD